MPNTSPRLSRRGDSNDIGFGPIVWGSMVGTLGPRRNHVHETNVGTKDGGFDQK